MTLNKWAVLLSALGAIGLVSDEGRATKRQASTGDPTLSHVHGRIGSKLMSKTWLVVTALGVVVIAAISILTLPSEKKYDSTQTFLEVELDRRVPINSRLKADIVCLVPAGMTPFGYLKQHYPGKTIDREFDPESESKWFVIAINDQDSQARILDVKSIRH